MPGKDAHLGPSKSHTIKVRLDEAQIQDVRVAAALRNVRASEYLRVVGLEAAAVAIKGSFKNPGT